MPPRCGRCTRLHARVELLFRACWKSLGGLAWSRGKKAARRECEVYAKLLGAMVTGWLLLLGGGWRVGRSEWQGYARVAALAMTLLAALGDSDGLIRLLAVLRWLLEKASRVGGRATSRPRTRAWQIPKAAARRRSVAALLLDLKLMPMGERQRNLGCLAAPVQHPGLRWRFIRG